MIQLLLGSITLIFTLVGALVMQWFKSKKTLAELDTANTKKDVAVLDQESKDLAAQNEDKKKDVSKGTLLNFLNNTNNK